LRDVARAIAITSTAMISRFDNGHRRL
jgi:hypothetical protein